MQRVVKALQRGLAREAVLPSVGCVVGAAAIASLARLAVSCGDVAEVAPRYIFLHKAAVKGERRRGLNFQLALPIISCGSLSLRQCGTQVDILHQGGSIKFTAHCTKGVQLSSLKIPCMALGPAHLAQFRNCNVCPTNAVELLRSDRHVCPAQYPQ